MGDLRSSLASRTLWRWFALAAVVPTAALVWLGFTVISRDRASEHQRRQTEHDRVADAGVNALARTVSDFEQQLQTFSTTGATADSTSAAFITFGRSGVVKRAGIRLPFYPGSPEQDSIATRAFAEADDLELSRGEARSAIPLLLPLTTSDEPDVRAGAWLRLGRVYRKVGDRQRALDAFGRLAALEELPIDGRPSGLVGRIARALILADDAHAAELQREAAALHERLRTGAWILTAAQFSHAIQQTEGWLGTASPAPRGETTALIGAADVIWSELRDRATDADTSTVRRAVGRGRQSVLALIVTGPQRITMMLIGAARVDEAWRRNLALTGAPNTTDFVLTDLKDGIVAGESSPRAFPQTSRPATVSKLPWNVTAIHRDETAEISLSATGRLLVAGIGLMLIVVLAGGYAINRAVSREMRVVRLQSDFVDAVSHEFRSPLTTIRQLSELLTADRVGTAERRQQFYATILSESQRMNRMVENLLDFGRLEAGRLAIRREPLDVAALIGDVTTDVRQNPVATAFQFELDADANVPQVLGDRDALAHVFRNLLDNAVKYSRDSRTVWVRVERQDRSVAVQVRDAGLGIPAKEQRDIFQKFVRGADATAARISGTGVGLALARQIVEAHGGTIGVDSSPGVGSTFTVTLPGLAT